MKRTTRRGAKRQAKRGRTYQCRFGPSPRRRPKSASIYARLPQPAGCGSVRTSAAAQESDHLNHSACSKRQMAAATGPVSSASWPLAQGQCHSGGKLPSCRGVNKTENLLILCSLEYCSLEFCFLLVDKARLALSSNRKQKYQNGNIH